jgi:hypothetical protein
VATREPVYVPVPCPACGQEKQVAAVVESVRVVKPTLGDEGALVVTFREGWAMHRCEP